MEKWVVVVDDDIVNLKRTGTILSGNGIHATAVRSGKALLEFLRTGTPDLILLDVLMPEMDGLETLRRLRAEGGPSRDIPVIMLTADEDPQTRIACLRAGAADYIRKPYDADALIRRVRAVLDRDPDSEVNRGAAEDGKADLAAVAALLEKQEIPP